MRRLLSVATLAMLTSVLFLFFATPGFATEGEADHADATDAPAEGEDADHADEGEMVEDTSHMDDADADEGEHAAESDDDNQWLGLEAALVAGVFFGVLAFTMSGVKGLGEEAHH